MIDFENFNWITASTVAGNGGMESDDHARLKNLANKWPTCACGSLCKNLPRNDTGSPQDDPLYEMGEDFASYVAKQEWDEAVQCFKRIEARTAKLLAKGGK